MRLFKLILNIFNGKFMVKIRHQGLLRLIYPLVVNGIDFWAFGALDIE